jgi:hypothetical protein
MLVSMAEIDLSKLGDALDTFLGEGGNDDLLNQIIENWWNQRVYPEIARSMDEKKINASSALKQSFVPGEIIKSPTSINTILLAEDYWEFVEFGRKPTRNGHIEGTPYLWQSIKEWIAYKGQSRLQTAEYDVRFTCQSDCKKDSPKGNKSNALLVGCVHRITCKWS